MATSYEDEWLAWSWSVDQLDLTVTLQNKTVESLTLRWDLSSFTAVDGNTHHLVDRGIGYQDRRSPKPAVRLNPGSTRQESVYPPDWLYWEDGKIVEWRCQALFPRLPGIATKDRSRAERFARAQLGKTIAVTLPVEAPNQSREYTFVLAIRDYGLKRFVGT